MADSSVLLGMTNDDVPVAEGDSLGIVQALMAFKEQSADARIARDDQNRINYEVAHCLRTDTTKVEGQSDEFLPKVAMAAEQLRAFIKNGMVAFGNWFQTELRPDPAVLTPPGQPPTELTASSITKLLKHRLENSEEIPPGYQDFPTTISDAIYTGALASLMVLKVHGVKVPTRRLSVNMKPIDRPTLDPTSGEVLGGVDIEEELVMHEASVWRLVIELVRPQDYYPDPTGRGLGEGQESVRDLYQVLDAAESMGYDLDVLELLVDSYADPQRDADIELETSQSPSTPPYWRKEVKLFEYWGNILDSEGNVAHRNCRCIVANDRFLLLPPEPNPYWHQQSPFVTCPLIRVPFSVLHKALFDDAVRLNLAANEIFNLMLDGGIAAVWGNKQVHGDLIDNMADFANGIPQGAVFIAKPEAPVGEALVMQIDSGTVPQEAMGMFQMTSNEFDAASKINAIQLGQLPKKDVRATEIAASEQSNNQFFDSMIADVERELVTKALRLAWLVMLQNADDWLAEDVQGILGPQAAKAFAAMSPAKRYMTYGQGARFKVHGLSAVLGRTREFQKIIAVIGTISQSPVLLQAFLQTSSPVKILHHLYKAINLDPEDFRMTEEEAATIQQRMVQTMALQGGGGGQQADPSMAGLQAQNLPQQQAGNPQQSMQAGTDRLQQPMQEM